jgi:hypothetical protein
MIRYDTGIAGWNDARRVFFRFLVMLGDAAIVAFAYGAAYLIRFYFPPFLEQFPAEKGIPEFVLYLKAGPVILFMWVLMLSFGDAYARINLPALDDLIRFFRIAMGATVLSMSAMFLYREISYSRLVFALGGAGAGLLLYLYREALKTACGFSEPANHTASFWWGRAISPPRSNGFWSAREIGRFSFTGNSTPHGRNGPSCAPGSARCCWLTPKSPTRRRWNWRVFAKNMA